MIMRCDAHPPTLDYKIMPINRISAEVRGRIFKKEKYRQEKKLLFPLFPLPRSPVTLTTSPLLSSPGPLYSRLCRSPFSSLPYSSEGYSILKEILLVFGSAPFQRAESLASVLPHPPLPFPLSLPVLSGSQGTPTLQRPGQGGAASEWGKEGTDKGIAYSLPAAERAWTATVHPLNSHVCLHQAYINTLH